MAPRPAIPNTAEFTLQYGLGSQTCQNIVHSTFTGVMVGGWNAANMATVAASLVAWWNGIRSGRWAGMSLVNINCLDLGTTGGGTRTSYATGLPTAGTAAGAPLQDGLAACVTLRSGLAGRSHRGRIYLAGLMNSDTTALDQNVWTAAAMTREVANVTSLIAALSGTVGGSPTEMRIVSWKHQTTTTVIGCGFADTYVDYQRRRAPGHNRHR